MKKIFFGSASLCLAAFLAGCGGDDIATETAPAENGGGISGTLDFYTSQPDADAQL